MEENTYSSMTAKEKLSNFWYYHKWHTVVALFLIFTLVICSVQMCNKTSYDIHIMYAGPHEFKRTSSGGDIPPYAEALSSLKRLAGDYNGDGETNVDFLDLYLLTSKEMQNFDSVPDKQLNYALLQENKEEFSNNLMYSDYYVCLLSTAIYEEYKIITEVPVFTPLLDYVNDGAVYSIDGQEYLRDSRSEKDAENIGANAQKDAHVLELYDNSAAYLSSTKLASLPEFSSLPSDTLVCLRIKSAVAEHFGKEEAQIAYQNSETLLKNIINQ